MNNNKQLLREYKRLLVRTETLCSGCEIVSQSRNFQALSKFLDSLLRSGYFDGFLSLGIKLLAFFDQALENLPGGSIRAGDCWVLQNLRGKSLSQVFVSIPHGNSSHLLLSTMKIRLFCFRTNGLSWWIIFC